MWRSVASEYLRSSESMRKLNKTFGSGIVVCLLCVLATSCSSTPRKKAYWYNPGVDASYQQNQYSYDFGKCNSEAFAAYPNLQRQKSNSGSFTVTDQRGNRATGTYQQNSIFGTGQPSGAMGGAAQYKQKRNRGQYINACLRNRGWTR